MSPPRGVGGASLYGPGGGSGADIWAERFFELSLAVDALKAGAGVLTVVKAVATAAVAIGGLPVIDGYQTVDADVVLLTAQASASQNGLWVTFASGWERPGDFTDDDVITSRTVVANAGTTTSGTIWALDTTPTVVVGTSPQVWVNTPVAGLTAALAALQAADALRIPLAQKGAANGVATLGADSKIPSAQLPALAIGETFPVASQAAMLALTAQRGDVAVRTDLTPDGFFLLTTDSPSTLADWVQITAAGGVFSVDGLSGAVDLSGIYAPIAEVAARIAGDGALDTRVDALEAGGGGGGGGTANAAGLTANCLNFPRRVDNDQESPNVGHGPFFLSGPMGHCLWEFWAMPRKCDGRYLLSDGYGGAHASLYGFSYTAESQTLTRTSTGGTITLSHGGDTTDAIPATSAGFTAAAVLAALLALPSVGPHGATVTGSAGGPLSVIFVGEQYPGENVPLLTVDNALATGGTVTVARVQPAAAGINSPQGNTYFAGGSNNIGFNADDDEGLYNGEWGYVAFAWDGNNICGIVNGIAVFVIPLSGRDTGGIGGTGNLNIGGSDHLNFDGHLAQVRGFEGSCPINVGQSYIPDFPFFSTLHGVLGYATSQFLADYQTPSGKIVPDLSDGFDGRTHPGTMRNPYGFHGGIQGPNWVNDPTMPFQAEAYVLPAEKVWTPPPTPVGAVNFDSFSRPNQTYATREKPSLGFSETGSAGPQEWLPRHPAPGHGDPTFGIFCGRAVPLAPGGSSVSYLPGDGSADMEIRVSRKGPSGRAGVTQTGIAFRVVDPGDVLAHPTEYWFCFQYGGAMFLGNTVDGLLINGVALPNANYHVQRVIAAGTSISLYVDDGSGGWAQVGTTLTSSRFQAATRAGLYSQIGDGLSRFDDFTRLAA